MRRISLLLCFTLALLTLPTLAAQPETLPWPTYGWQSSTPEAQGMDSQALAAALEQVVKDNLNIHSLLVIRNGYLIMEAYRYPYAADTLHQLYSATKSFTSALFGIAAAQGYIKNLDQPMLDFFPGRAIANLDASKPAITLENLLTMSSGLDWKDDLLDRSDLNELYASKDWLQFVLDKPMKYKPDQLFVYNTGGSNLLAGIIEQATGQPMLQFAQTNLFEPLGIHTVNWWSDPQGHYLGGLGLELTPRDTAKFGYLFLNQGQWDGQQIIPVDWVAASTRKHIAARPLAEGYGYQWWIDETHRYYMAIGYGGQYIIVDPEQNLVVVFTSGLNTFDALRLETVMQKMILPAVTANAALPENPDGKAALQTEIDALAHPVPEPVPALPETATRISGQIYRVADNDLGWHSLELSFTEGADTAQFTLNDIPYQVGLDNVVRVNQQASTPPVLAQGQWAKENRFVLLYNYSGSADTYSVTLTFKDQEVTITQRSVISGHIDTAKGTAA